MYILGSVITGRDRRGRDRMVVGFTTYAISCTCARLFEEVVYDRFRPTFVSMNAFASQF
jgi:hypothetical protein